MANVGQITARITLENSQFNRGMDEARGKMQQLSSSSANVQRDLGGIQKASMVVGGAIVAAVGASTNAAATLEKTMSKVRAITNATDEDMQRMKSAAISYGESTAFSATQVGDSLVYLGQAGLDVNQSLDALPSVLSLAAAGGIGLADSANYVTNIMSGFKIEANETAKVVDILAKAASTANTDVPGMAEAFKMVGPVAASLNFTIEETAAAIGELANIGIAGSQAGTVLRASMLSLANPVGQAKKAMEEYGISVLDANGNMKPLPELIGHVGKQLEGMTDAQKTAAAAQLVGVEAASGFIGLLNVGEEGLRNYTAELENAGGTAERMATTQMDNLKGSFEEFQGAIETLGIKIGDEFLPVFRDVVDAGADVVRFIGEFDSESLRLGLSFAGITAAIAGTLATLSKLSLALSAFALTPIGGAIIGLSLLGGIIGTVAMQQAEATEINLEATQAKLDEADAMRASIEQYDALKSQLRLSSDELARFVDINSLLAQTADPAIIAALKDEQAALQEKSGLTNEEFAELLRLNGLLIETVPEANVKLTEQGNVLLETTSAAKALNAEKYESVRLDLEADLAAAESKQAENIAEQTRLQQLLNDEKRKSDEIVTKITEQETFLGTLQAQYRKAEADGNTAMMQQIQGVIDAENINLQQLRDKNAEHKGNIVTHAEALRGIEKEIGKLDQTKQKMVELELQQVGINAEKGEGLNKIDETIRKLQGERSEIEKTTPVAARKTGEYEEAVGAIGKQISALETARSRVLAITGAASSMNAELGRAVTKTVTIRNIGGTARGGGRSLKPMPDLDYHTGGLVGKNPLNRMPKLHTGGTVAALADKFSAPMQHEMDVRLLRNEMVITESQQANLMRMIDAGHTARGGGDMGETNAILRDIKAGLDDGKDIQIVMNERQVARAITPYVTERQEHDNAIKRTYQGGRG